MPKPSTELLPPGINPNSLQECVLDSVEVFRNPQDYILKRQKSFGPIFVGASLGEPVVYIADYYYANEFYKVTGIVAAADIVKAFAPSSMNLVDPKRHSEIKHMVQPVFQSVNIQRHTDYGLELKTLVHDMVSDLIEKQEGYEEVQVMPAVGTLTLRMMGHILGVGNDSDSTKLLQEIISGFKYPLPFLKGRIQKAQNIISSLINGGTITDGMFYEHFLKNDSLKFSDEELRDNFTALLLGGQSTTAHFLTMLFYNLSQYPHFAREAKDWETADKLREEIKKLEI